ncbi:MarR family transcriptional regulator [soil metagenome]
MSERDDLIQRLMLLGQIDATQTALFQQRAAASYGLGITEMKALDILTREGPQTAGQLTAALHLTSGAITGVVDRLEKRGLAHRGVDADDRRKVIVTADLQQLASGENVYLGIGQAFADLHGSYSTAELEFLVRHLEASTEITKRETERLKD